MTTTHAPGQGEPEAHTPTGGLDGFFHISERGSTVGREVRGGVVTFFAMAYIVLLNPLILGTSPDRDGTVLGIPQVAAVTALTAGVMCILFGVIARYLSLIHI